MVLFAPVVDGQPATAALAAARAAGLALERAVYLGLDVAACEEARRAGFFRAHQAAVPGAGVAGSPIDTAGHGKLRVLLADDSDLIHKHTVPLLTGAGYEVTEAWDGEEALELLDK